MRRHLLGQSVSTSEGAKGRNYRGSMVSLRIFLLILLTLLCREVAVNWADGEHQAYWSVGRAAVAVLAFGLLHKSLILGLLARNQVTLEAPSFWKKRSDSGVSDAELYQSASKIREIVEYLWVGSLPAVLLLTGWASWLTSMEEMGASKTLLVIAWFAPSMLFIVFLEWTGAQLEEILLLRSKSQAAAVPSWQGLFYEKIRAGDFASVVLCLAPLLSISVCNDMLQSWLGASATNWSGSASSVCGLVAFALLGPHLISKWIGGASENAALHARFQMMMLRAGTSGIRLHILSSQSRWTGAAIVGWLPGFRHLWLSESIVEHFTPEQTDMVLMHEMAHVRRRHFLLRLLPLGVAAVVLLPMAYEPPAAVAILSAVLAIAVVLVGIRLVAHYCEFDADREACQLARKLDDWSTSVSPEKALTQALMKLSGTLPTNRHTWLHPSIESRIGRLAAE